MPASAGEATISCEWKSTVGEVNVATDVPASCVASICVRGAAWHAEEGGEKSLMAEG